MTNYDSIKSFAVKTSIVAAAVVVSLWITLEHVNSLVEQSIYDLTATINNATKFRADVFWPRIEAGIVKAADPSQDISPERKAKLAEAIRVLRVRWQPVLDELVIAPTPEHMEQRR